MVSFQSRDSRVRLTLVDAGWLVCAAAALVIALGGRTRLDLFGVRVSLRSPINALLLASVLAVVRLWIGGLTPLLPLVPRPPRHRFERERQRMAHPPARPRAYWPTAVAAAVVCLSCFLPQLAHIRRVPDAGDPVFSAWRLACFAHQLAHDPRHLFDGNIFYPTPGTLAYSDATVLQGLLGAPFILTGADPLIVANAIKLLSTPLAAIGFFWLGWRLTASLRVAFLTALLGALAEGRTEQYSHIEMQFTVFMPLALGFLLDVAARPTWRRGAGLGAAVVGQWLAGMYLGVMLLMWLVPVGTVVLFAWARRPWRPLLGAIGAAGLVIVVGFGTLAWPYRLAQRAHGPWGYDTITEFSATGADYRRPSQFWPWWSDPMDPHEGERRLFPGFATPALAGLGAIPPLDAIGTAALIGGTLAFDWSLGTHGLSYDDLLRHFPSLGGMRVPARFSVLVVLTLIALAALGTRRLLDIADTRRLGVAAITALVAAVLLFDLRARIPLTRYWPAPPPIYAAVDPSMVLAEFPITGDANIAYMYFSTRHWARLLNGYSGFFPARYVLLQEEVKTFPSPAALAVVRSAGATHVSYNCRLEPDPWRCEQTIAALDANPALERVAAATWEAAPVVLYRFR